MSKMTQMVEFAKMHGAGNDYIYINTSLYNIPSPEKAAKIWSAPHTGIGSDGLVLIGVCTAPEADFTMRIFNADGSEAMMCGNASRCVAKYLYEKGLTTQTQIRLLTLSGVKLLQLHLNPEGGVDSVTVDMGEPVFENKRQYDPSIASLPDGFFVSMGNPHYVIFSNDAETEDIAGKGALLEHNKAFPERCNIEFATIHENGIRMRVWERGSGITMACGTGASATAVAACKTGHCGRKSHIIMDGGTLDIEWCETDNHVYMTGPAELVFEGKIKLPL